MRRRGSETRETSILDDILPRQRLLTGDLILAEVLQGFRSDRDLEAARQALGRLAFVPMVGHDVALASALNYRRLRAKGVTVRKTIDVLIATFCATHGHVLLHSDRDFTGMAPVLGPDVV